MLYITYNIMLLQGQCPVEERHNMMNVQLAATLFAFFTPEIQCAYML